MNKLKIFPIIPTMAVTDEAHCSWHEVVAEGNELRSLVRGGSEVQSKFRRDDAGILHQFELFAV